MSISSLHAVSPLPVGEAALKARVREAKRSELPLTFVLRNVFLGCLEQERWWPGLPWQTPTKIGLEGAV